MAMEINCLKCELFGKCDFFPALSNWTGNCQIRIPHHWESEKDNKTTNSVATGRLVTPVFFRFGEEKKEPPVKTVFCGNGTCTKKGWCNDGIARHCKLLQPIATQDSKERRERHYDE